MAHEITGTDYESKQFNAKRSGLMRRRDSLIREGVLTEADFESARGKRKYTSEQIKVLQQGGFKKYREAQQRLMDLDPKSYGKYRTTSTLDSELHRLLQFGTIKSATGTLPNDFLASFEHFQGITPASITQDPSALRKVGIVGKKYNWKIMGKQGKYSPYTTVKTYLRTAREELKLNNLKAANEALKKVNIVYDEVQENLKTVNRKELPKYKIKGNNIIEINVKGIIKPQTLQKSFDQYFRNIAGYATEKDINRIKKTQPNVAKALDLYKTGKIKEARDLIKLRIPDVKAGKLFSKALGPIAWGSIYDDILKLRTEGKSWTEAIGHQVLLGDAQKDWQERKYTSKHLTPAHVQVQNRVKILELADKNRISVFDVATASERDSEYKGSPHKYIEWLKFKVREPDQQGLLQERRKAIDTGMVMSPEKIEEAKEQYKSWKSIPGVRAIEELFKSDEQKAKDLENLLKV